MKFQLITIGKSKANPLRELEAEYLKRIRPTARFELVELDANRFSSLPEHERKLRETELMLAKVPPADFLILLDEHGKSLTSLELAAHIQKAMNGSVSSFWFAIGGALGWDKLARKRSNLCLSLSQLTMPYQIARLVTVEQIYRVVTLIKGIPYHK